MARLRQADKESSDSDVVYLNLFGADHVILNSNEAISDLLDKRSAIYSDRVRIFEPMVGSRTNFVEPPTSRIFL